MIKTERSLKDCYHLQNTNDNIDVGNYVRTAENVIKVGLSG